MPRGVTLRQLWQMAQGAREARRMLALDVRALVWQSKKFDADRFLRTGYLQEYKQYDPPDSPELRAEEARLREEQRNRRGR